ncbi:MAG: DUF2017 domain-containing protein [Aeromicrobium erythreum]
MKPFRRRRRGGLCATFEPGEAQVLASLTGQVVELLHDRGGTEESSPDPLAMELGLGGPTQPPEDPVLQRLLPDAYRDDPEDSAEFRKFTERSLLSAKVANAETLLTSLAEAGFSPDGDGESVVEVELDPGQVQAWLRSLTDVRLALAVRLGIETDEDSLLVHESEDEAVAAMADVYDWLGYVQESLVLALE